MSIPRIKRAREALKQAISSIIHGELKDPRIGFLTVTNVEVTPDMRVVKVYYSILGTAKNKKDTAVGLNQAKGYIRRLMAERVKLRYAPEILFYLDEANEYTQRIQEIIDKIHEKDKEGSSDVGKKDD